MCKFLQLVKQRAKSINVLIPGCFGFLFNVPVNNFSVMLGRYTRMYSQSGTMHKHWLICTLNDVLLFKD